MKFVYINSNGEKSLYEAEPLTGEVYGVILEQDRNVLEKISLGLSEESNFNNELYQSTALQMLQNYGKGRDAVFSEKENTENCVLLIKSKTILEKNKIPLHYVKML